MHSFNFIDIILFLGVSQGLFLSVSLRLINDRNKLANKALSFLLLIATVMLLGRIIAFRIPEDWVWRFGVLADTSIFLFGPLVYLHVRRLLFNEASSYRLPWGHYLPSVCHLGYYFWTLSIPLADFNTIYFSGSLNLVFFIVEALGLVSFIFYGIKTLLLVKKYKYQEEKQLSYHQAVYSYLQFFLATLFIFALLWLVSFISANFFRRFITYINYSTMWISTPLFIYVVGYFSLRQPEVFRIPLRSKAKSEKDRLNPEQIQKLQKRLQYYMNEEKTFLQSDLTLKILAEKMNTSSNDLSWLLNQTYQKSFYDYINKLRIDEFIKKIDNNEHVNHTLLTLALDSGFNSKSTFNRVFKTVIGSTPREYLKDRKAA